MGNDTVQRAFPGLMGTDEKGETHMVVAPLHERRIINEWDEIPIRGFQELFEAKAGALWPQIEKLFNEYGPVLSIPFCSACMYAQEDGKLQWCIELLEKHLKEDLSYQHPELRGRLMIGGSKNRSQAFLEQEIIKVLRP